MKDGGHIQPSTTLIYRVLSKMPNLQEIAISDLVDKLFLKHFGKGAVLQESQQIGNEIYFLEKGMAKHFYSGKRKEQIVWFSKEGDFVASASFFAQKPAYEIIEAIEDIECFALKYYDFEQLCQKHPCIEHWVRMIMTEQLFLLDEHYAKNHLENAEQRYLNFIRDYPEFANRIPLNYIASFLSITPETLSRIRAHM